MTRRQLAVLHGNRKGPIKPIAEQSGVHPETLRTWVKACRDEIVFIVTRTLARHLMMSAGSQNSSAKSENSSVPNEIYEPRVLFATAKVDRQLR